LTPLQERGLSRWIAAFLKHLDVERNASPHTVRSYGTDLAAFSAYVEHAIGPNALASGIDHMLIRSYLAKLHHDGLAKSSASRKLAAVRSLFRYLCREGAVERNPARALLSPRVERRLPAYVEAADVAQFVEISTDAPSGLRARAILELLYGTGIRCSELVALDLPEVDFGSRLIRVLGKGRKERVVPFGSAAQTALEAYVQERHKQRWATDALFVNRRGGRLTDPAAPHLGAGPKGESTHAPPRLRHSPARARSGSQNNSGAVGARKPLDNAEVHARHGSPTAGDLQEVSSARLNGARNPTPLPVSAS
jgi:integrase/recombinase XerC